MTALRTLPFLFASIAAALPASAAPLLAPIFADHAVLQRDRPIAIWGEAAPGETVTVVLGQVRTEATAGPDGHWRALVPALAAGGPHRLFVRAQSGAAREISDILIGDVYVCSGQSNMQLTVARSLDLHAESQADDDSIRMLTVPPGAAPAPQADFAAPPQWLPTKPETVQSFSAACYYFARELRKTHKIPLGLIVAAAGGSNIRAWLNQASLRRLGGHDDDLDIENTYATDRPAAMRAFAEKWQGWWRKAQPEAGEPWRPGFDDGGWSEAPEGLGHWTDWPDPKLAGFTGQLWFRTHIHLNADEAAKAATLSLGTLNEEDVTWLNGKPVGVHFGYGAPRRYDLPAGVLRAGDNLLAVNVLCTYRGCGIFGPAGDRYLQLADGGRKPLNEWRYSIVPHEAGPPPRAPWGSIPGLGTLANAMLTPIGPYGINGALWYQGESNVGETEDYGAMLQALILQWREQFGRDLPVLVVQLPNYAAPAATPVESGWAVLREAQRRATLRDAKTALIVTIDIGLRTDIHPANKQEVGRRLARAARALIYGEKIAASGPRAVSATRRGDKVILRFADVEDALIAYSAATPIGFELCGAKQASCRFARAAIEKNRVILFVPPKFKPSRVRYLWADSPVCNLYDASGLPAGPFEMRIADQ